MEIRDLVVGYGWRLPPTVTPVRGVSLTVDAGEVVGVAGESGCGKTTLALAASGLLDPPGRILSGSALFEGTDLTTLTPENLRHLRLESISMVFQASMNVLNPVMRIERQFRDAMAAHGVNSRTEARRRAEEAFDMVKVPRHFLDAYPHQLSGGMRQRAVIALALVLRPKLLVLDEPTTALDVVVQRAILQSIDDLRRELGFGIIFITHDLSLLVESADRIAIMYAGRIVEEAPARELYDQPYHPYTKALMTGFPPLGGERRRLQGIAGQPPDLRQLPKGCSFASRCPQFIAGTCDEVDPPNVTMSPTRRVECHLFQEVGSRVD
jgi:oligopeptide/dipeptide ABC transporter ATP-binding protein